MLLLVFSIIPSLFLIVIRTKNIKCYLMKIERYIKNITNILIFILREEKNGG